MSKQHEISHPKHQPSSEGFTILELMIATMIFSIILLVAAAGILRFSNDYYKGVNTTNTQAVTRSIMNDIAQSIQFSSSDIHLPALAGTGTPTPYSYCIDDTAYTYAIGQPASASTPALIRSEGNCSALVPAMTLTDKSDARDLLSDNMRLGEFTIEPASGVNAYTITLSVIYGDDDLLVDANGKDVGAATNWSTVRCKAQQTQQFCAVSHLKTTVQQRL